MGLDKPKNIEEAVSIVFDAMSSDQKEHLKQVPQEDLINEHFSFALWVRNLLGHWVSPTPESEGYNPAHPDDISGNITEMIWRRLHNED